MAATIDRSEASLAPQQVFSQEGLEQLNERSNWRGILQLFGHFGISSASGCLWFTHVNTLWIGLPALVLYGFSLAAMFAPMHEAGHRTAFASNWLNDGVAWVAGLLSFYNSSFYRRYHKWHHRYTRIPGKDPELADPTPSHLADNVWQVSGIPWWIGKLKGHLRCATGQMQDMPYIPETARSEIQRSVQIQLGIYAIAIVLSWYFHSYWFAMGWVLPLAIGQPLLRLILLAEHTGCSLDANPFDNTRTTLTWAPLRFLMWNMPFHAEHHFCPSIPFHALGRAHQILSPHLHRVSPGYTHVNVEIIRNLGYL